MKKIICFVFTGFVLLSLPACFSGNGELVGNTTTRLDFTIDTPHGMRKIPAGSFTMGSNDQDVPYASRSNMQTITMSPFWIDETEITNAEYRQFTHWVRDSIIRKALINDPDNPNSETEWGWPSDPNANWNQVALEESDERMERNDLDNVENYHINWYKNLNFNKSSVTKAMIRTLILDDEEGSDFGSNMHFYDDESDNEKYLRPHFQTKLIDKRRLVYDYTWFDATAAASRNNTYEYGNNFEEDGYVENERAKQVNRTNSFIHRERVPVYPDTLTWVRDFTYNFNEPMFDKYNWHPAFDDYPVVGVSWQQAKAFCHWRTEWKLYHLPQERRVFETSYRLPTEAEWEWAARAGRELAMFPWGGPYSRNSKGCFLANFKPLRGNYWADGYIYTAPVNEYFPNDYGLYNMAGNVAEWTESAFDPMSDIFSSDLNPEYTYNADNTDHPHFKKKVIKGGSWKDIGAFLQIGARDYEYQDSSRCYVGFRCVKSPPFNEEVGARKKEFKAPGKNSNNKWSGKAIKRARRDRR
ncbi:MAG: gliding motility-associated lipoprotein [Flavobacteriales bacterium]|nr:gliding motility-associated lipoprotein [Flavobacteriales bacterium]